MYRKKWLVGWMDRKNRWMVEWIEEKIDGQIKNGWLDGLIEKNRQMVGWMVSEKKWMVHG